MDEREGRIGYWISGVAHGSLILWAVLGGALFRPQPSPPVRTTEVSTISGAEFEALAAASRGAGPVGAEATAVASLSERPATAESDAARPVDASPPEATQSVPLAAPDAAETAPDLDDLAALAPAPVDVATDLPAPVQPQDDVTVTLPEPAVPTVAPLPEAQPSQPAAPQPDRAATPVAPRSILALDRSPRPQGRPQDLVANYNRRQAEAEERRAAEAAERAAEERRAAEAAEREAEERRAAEREAEERRAAEAAEREAEERRAAEAAERAAEERRAAEAAEREAEERRAAEAAEREAEERQAAEAAREAAERQAAADAAREEADRQALEDALREAQQGQAGAEGTDTASTGTAQGGDRQMIEGGSGASAGMDPLAAALAGAMAGGDPAPEPGVPADAMQLVPSPMRATPLPDPAQGLPMGDPLSLAEREGLRFAIQNCWNVGALSVEASRMTVSVGMTLSPDGVPDPDSLRMAGFRGGSEAGAQQAFDVARRAILMCGRSGFDLPPQKYGRWRDVVVDFRPDGVEF
ncbi:MAG: protein TolA [Paracoccus sp. (in: a-proteobacteria)]|uniref:protein TolA n=1 Tax=Paracoccus sp. TaxID=267 RepID=UPI004058D4F6